MRPIQSMLASVIVLLLVGGAEALPPGPETWDLALEPADWSAFGARSHDELALLRRKAIAVGDLNGDGWIDLALGSVGADGRDGDRPIAGRVDILFGPLARGRDRDLSVEPGELRIFGPAERASTGAALAVGDVDADGWLDLLVGSPRADPANPAEGVSNGRIDILFGPLAPGTVDLALPHAGTTFLGGRRTVVDIRGDGIGHSIAVGDVSGDGVPDLVIAGPGYRDPDTGLPVGSVRIVFGPIARGVTHDFATTPADTLIVGPGPVEPGGWLSAGLGMGLAIDDFDADGQLDLAIGGRHGVRSEGRVHVLLGPIAPGVRDLAAMPSDVDVGADLERDGILGRALAGGDLNGDGFTDLILGAEFADSPEGDPQPGAVFVLLGPLATGRRIDSISAEADIWLVGVRPLSPALEENSAFGHDLAVGDVNGDGFQDLLVGAVGNALRGGHHDPGEAALLWGPLSPGVRRLAEEPPALTVLGRRDGDALGVVALADLTGDGRADLIIGAGLGDGPDGEREDAGEVHVILGDNRPPKADPGGPYFQECARPVDVDVDGTGSSDPDEDDLAYEWTTDCPSASFDDPASATPTLWIDPVEPSCELTCSVRLRVIDPFGLDDIAETAVTIRDTTPPVVTLASEPLELLWPPNHRIRCLTAADLPLTAVDACSDTVEWRFVDCLSDQPDDGLGDGHHAPDCFPSDDGGSLCVRSERQGGVLEGRRYTVLAEAVDACGNSTGPVESGEIHVVHDQRSRSSRSR